MDSFHQSEIHLSPFQLFSLDVKKRNEEFFKELSPLQILKRIAYQWSMMSQGERRNYYEMCGVHIDKAIAMKIRKLNRTSFHPDSYNPYNSNSLNSEDSNDSSQEGSKGVNNTGYGAKSGDEKLEKTEKNRDTKNSEEEEYAAPKRGRKKVRGNNKDSYNFSENDSLQSPRRGRRKRKN